MQLELCVWHWIYQRMLAWDLFRKFLQFFCALNGVDPERLGLLHNDPQFFRLFNHLNARSLHLIIFVCFAKKTNFFFSENKSAEVIQRATSTLRTSKVQQSPNCFILTTSKQKIVFNQIKRKQSSLLFQTSADFAVPRESFDFTFAIPRTDWRLSRSREQVPTFRRRSGWKHCRIGCEQAIVRLCSDRAMFSDVSDPI